MGVILQEVYPVHQTLVTIWFNSLSQKLDEVQLHPMCVKLYALNTVMTMAYLQSIAHFQEVL